MGSKQLLLFVFVKVDGKWQNRKGNDAQMESAVATDL